MSGFLGKFRLKNSGKLQIVFASFGKNLYCCSIWGHFGKSLYWHILGKTELPTAPVAWLLLRKSIHAGFLEFDRFQIALWKRKRKTFTEKKFKCNINHYGGQKLKTLPFPTSRVINFLSKDFKLSRAVLVHLDRAHHAVSITVRKIPFPWILSPQPVGFDWQD